MSKVIFAAIFALVVLGTARASAEDSLCPLDFRIPAGTEGRGVATARAGTVCQMSLAVYGNLTLSSIAIIRGPSNGSASPRSTGIRYKPKAGYSGRDSMTIRLLGVSGTSGKPVQGILHIEIHVY